jgi:acyl carrier protein
MERVVAGIRERFDGLDGVIHAAGIAGGGMILLKTRQAAAQVMTPKIQGTLVLARAVADLNPDFLMLCSSVSSVLGEFGQVDYCAANAFMDAYAERGLNGISVVSVNWHAWREVGMAVNTELPENLRKARDESLKKALSPREGAAAFHRLLATGEPRMVVSTLDLETVIEQTVAFKSDQLTAAGAEPAPESARTAHPRPQLAAVFVAPRNKTEQAIAEIWQKQIGIDRVGVADNFFELGGDSLMGLQVVALINRELGTNITAASLYEAPTVGAVAKLMHPEQAEAAPSFKREASRGSARKAKIRKKKKRAM